MIEETILGDYLDLTVDTEGSPPCQVLMPPPPDDRPCGKPSYKRVRYQCPCTKAEYMFVCRPCDEKIRAGDACCHYCGSYEFTMSPA